ncbi:MAG: cystine transporter YijE [Candidatus Elarobacter sp.]
MIPGRSTSRAYAALAVLALVWGYTWVVIKIATRDASPYVVAGGRIGIAAIVLFVALALTRRSLRPTPIGPTIVLGLLQTTGFTLFQTIAVSIAGAGKTAVLAYTMPFWVAILAWPFLGERIAGMRWAALALAAIGLAFVITPLGAHAILADALAVLAGISWAASAVYAKRLRASHEVELLSLTAWQLAWGAIPLVALMLFVPGHVNWTVSFVAAMTFMSVLGGAMGWLLWMFVISRLPAGVAGIASLATPVVGVLSAAIQLHEIPSTFELTGMACIIVALLLNAAP